jgi:hypothetical protein
MCKEMTPMMSLVVPFFDGLISTWQRMRRDPAYIHLYTMLDAGIEKLVEQLGQYRFSKAAILSIGMFVSQLGSKWFNDVTIVLNPPLGWQWLEANWPTPRVQSAREIIIRTVSTLSYI